MQRQTISNGGRWEAQMGYSRAVRVDDRVYVSGTIGVAPDGTLPPTPYEQARRALEIIEAALTRAGASLADVVRTRVFVADLRDFEEVARAHGESFGVALPATSVVQVAGLLLSAAVEIEADAVIGSGT